MQPSKPIPASNPPGKVAAVKELIISYQIFTGGVGTIVPGSPDSPPLTDIISSFVKE